ncbi:MAG: hypothetical protein MJ182_09535 [Treponema sp.]|nr:hypothetical protein [Treponema sp.]
MKILLANNPGNDDCWAYDFDEKGVCYAPFDGTGNIWGAESVPDLTKGFDIKLQVLPRTYLTTQIKSVEVYRNGKTPKKANAKNEKIVGEVNPGANLVVDGVRLGSHVWHSFVTGNVINWERFYDNGNAGWKFPGRDMSEYDRVRVEIESTDVPVHLRIASNDWENSFGFPSTGNNVFEAKLSGEGSWDEGRPEIDFTKVFYVFLDQYNNNVIRTEESKTVVKSIKFLKPGEFVDEGPLATFGRSLGGHTWQSHVSGNVITWEKGYDNADAGWNFTGMDLSVYDRVRVEIESTDAPVHLRFADKDWNLSIGFPETEKNIFEAKLTGEGSWEYEGEPMFNLSKGLRIYLNQWNDNVVRAEDKTTVVKSIQFLKPGEVADANTY